MNRIPVGRTIAFAYAYVFHHIGAVVSVSWLPAIVFAIADAVMRLFPNETGPADELAAAPGRSVASLIAIVFVVIAQSTVAVSITRQVLGQRATGLAAQFALDRTGLRMVAANFRYFLGGGVLAVFAVLISTFAFWLAGVPLDMPEAAQASIASLIAVVLSLSLFGYVAVTLVRMGFFLNGVVVAEEKSGLKRSHDLAIGNLWRMVAVLAALMLPVTLLRVAAPFAALDADILSQEDAGAAMQLDEVAIRQQIVPWEIFNALLFVVGSGLLYSGLAYAYRRVALETPEATPSPPVSGSR